MLTDIEQTQTDKKEYERDKNAQGVNPYFVVVDMAVHQNIASGANKVGKRVVLDDSLKDGARNFVRIK